MWTDTDKTLALAYGAASSANQRTADRVSVLLDGDGTLLLEYLDVAVSNHPAEVLADCRILFAD